MPSSPFREMSVSRSATMISGTVHRETRYSHVAVGRFDSRKRFAPELGGTAISLIRTSIAYPARLALVRPPPTALRQSTIENHDTSGADGQSLFFPAALLHICPYDAKWAGDPALVARALIHGRRGPLLSCLLLPFYYIVHIITCSFTPGRLLLVTRM